MEENKPIVEITERWVEEDGQCQECPMCGDKIYGKAYRMVIDIGEKTVETPIVLCNSCKEDALNENE